MAPPFAWGLAMTESFVPVLLMILFGVGLAGFFLIINWMIGKHQRNPSKLSPYEGGVPLLDVNRKRINVRFYQIAMLFILFDIEAAFIYPWAVIYREATVTADGIALFAFVEMIVFITLLAIGYIYVWKKNAFDWN
jgi:NADH-quinone oxidoreductase subunit A